MLAQAKVLDVKHKVCHLENAALGYDVTSVAGSSCSHLATQVKNGGWRLRPPLTMVRFLTWQNL